MVDRLLLSQREACQRLGVSRLTLIAETRKGGPHGSGIPQTHGSTTSGRLGGRLSAEAAKIWGVLAVIDQLQAD